VNRRATRGSPARRRVGAPWVLAVPAGIGLVFLAVPLLALVIRTPWGSLTELLPGTVVLPALRLSLQSATAATAASVLFGVPLAWVLARTSLPGKRVVRTLVTLPLVLPPVVGGIALLLAFGRRGVLGGPFYDLTGYSLPFSTAAVVVAETFVAMPFLVITVEGALHRIDGRHEEASATLGAGRWTTFRRVTLPMVGPSVAAGTVLCWARALGEFGATITFAGSFPGTTETMPLAVYLAQQQDPDAAIALALVLLVVSMAILLALRQRWLYAGPVSS